MRRATALLAATATPAGASFAAKRRLISFATEVRQAQSSDELLAVVARRPALPSEAATLLTRLVALTPDDEGGVRADERLHALLKGLEFEQLAPDELATVVWALAMLRRPLRRSELAWASMASLLDEAAAATEVHAAAQAAWGYQSLSRDGATKPSQARAADERIPRLLARAATLPFAVHLRAVPPEILSVESLVAESAPRREVIKSGSAAPSRHRVTERRLTAWQSEAGAAFEYSGKCMEPRVGESAGAGFSPAVRAVRDAVAGALGHTYDSVLLNHYEGGESGMNFHSDPGQGEAGGWGRSTCVVSAGACRRLVFRRTGAPELRCTYRLRDGDVLEMGGDCQDRYQHSIAKEPLASGVGPRVSLVFKRTWANELAASKI